MELDESALIHRVLAQDDRLAFRHLVLKHQSDVRMFLRRVLVDAALADDCAQETWLTAYQKLSGFRGGSFRAWIFTIGMRKALRMRARDRNFTELSGDETASQVPEGLKLDLEKALSHLSVPERSCLHLASCEDLSHEEIAAILELPLGTVKSHLLRGKDKLKRLLASEVTHARSL